jgi:hypothetical protein
MIGETSPLRSKSPRQGEQALALQDEAAGTMATRSRS